MSKEVPTPPTATDITKPASKPANVISAETVKVPVGTTIDETGAVNIPMDPEQAERDAAAAAEANPQEQLNDENQEPPKEPADIPNNDPDALEDAATKLGVDYGKLTEEYAKTGKLSEESIKEASEAMAKHGVQGGDEIIRDVINNREVTQTLLNGEFVKLAGSAEAWNSAYAWASSSEAPVDVRAVLAKESQKGATVGSTLEAAKFIVDRFKQSGPVRGERVEPSSKPAADPDLFHGQDEMAAAMADPRYSKDPSYRRGVEARIVKSMQAGTLTQ